MKQGAAEHAQVRCQAACHLTRSEVPPPQCNCVEQGAGVAWLELHEACNVLAATLCNGLGQGAGVVWIAIAGSRQCSSRAPPPEQLGGARSRGQVVGVAMCNCSTVLPHCALGWGKEQRSSGHSCGKRAMSFHQQCCHPVQWCEQGAGQSAGASPSRLQAACRADTSLLLCPCASSPVCNRMCTLHA